MSETKYKGTYTSTPERRFVERARHTEKGVNIDEALDDIDEALEKLVALEVSDITALTNEQCNSLKAGNIVVKKTGNQKHSYRVSYKEDNQGMCLTYVDASVSETVSYDYVGGNWTYNSTDVCRITITNPTISTETLTFTLEDDSTVSLDVLVNTHN